nr:MAG TPA: hypothetical protein [Bacteriophage sp.]
MQVISYIDYIISDKYGNVNWFSKFVCGFPHLSL